VNSLFQGGTLDGAAYIAPHTQVPRISTVSSYRCSCRWQCAIPVVLGYNLSKVDPTLQPPVAADRSFFAKCHLSKFRTILLRHSFGYHERRSIFRFSIGRTF